MPIFATLGIFTEKGKALITDKEASEKHMTQQGQVIASLGGQLIEVYFTMGRYDYIMITEFPDEESALKCLFLSGAAGTSVTETLLAFSREKTLAIMKELP